MSRFLQSMQAFAAPQARTISGGRGVLAIFSLIILNQAMNLGATTGFIVSGRSDTLTHFLLWQIVGGIFGLGTQLTFAGLVRFSSIKLANAVGIGLAFVSAEVFAAYKIFNEHFTPAQWMGVALVGCGIFLIAWGKR